jgi:dsDNA-specific endonuclease/ATPase MutS2
MMTESVELPIEDNIDLHSFPPREIPDLIEEYLYQAVRRGYREVRIIHGRGIGVQRNIVHSILKQDPRVIHFRDAADRGSTIVTLAGKQRSKFPIRN